MHVELLTFPEFQEGIASIFKNFKILKLQDIVKSNILKLICMFYNDQFSIKNQTECFVN